jgi:5-amino-6-(5-phosphoribosylamino)uracil reductase
LVLLHVGAIRAALRGRNPMNLRMCFNTSEDKFPLPPQIKQRYGSFGFPERAETDRPYITSNLVMALDGKASFRELKGRAGGNVVSKSADDRWLMDFYRAHHDAQLIGASTLREELGANGQSLDYGIDDEELQTYRRDILKLGPQKVIVLTGSGNVNVGEPIFNSPRVEPWIITSAEGETNLRAQLKKSGRDARIKIISVGHDGQIDVSAAIQLLRKRHGIATLLCEGGPNLYSQLLKKQLIDEDFRTISAQVLGASANPSIPRPTTYGDVSYTPETAPWFRLISMHVALPYHTFLRLCYEGPRKFSE